MSARQDIVTVLLGYMNNISIANGYSFDINSNVFEWRTGGLNDTEKPGLVLRDSFSDTVEGDSEHSLNIEIAIYAEGGTSPATIRAMMQDVLTAFQQIESSVEGAQFVSTEMEVDHQNKKEASAWLNFNVNYYTNRWEI